MSVLSDPWIKKMALENEMIKPFVAEQKANKNIFTFKILDIIRYFRDRFNVTIQLTFIIANF